LLLPDGRVLSGGGDGNTDAEVYSPGYLFKGPRPIITSAPGSVTYGGQFFVGTADQISRVTLVRLSSVTHSFNMDQRITRLAFSAVADGLNVTGPATPELSPPGYYMLFVLDNRGVPSVASIVKVDAAPLQSPAAPSDLTTTRISGGRIDVTWTDHASNEQGFRIERCTGIAGIACTDFSQIAQTGPNATTYSDTGVGPFMAYGYRARAFNSAGVSAYSNVATAPPLISLFAAGER
jgi:hypothetical protein